MKSKIIVIWIVLITFCVITGIFTRLSYKDHTSVAIDELGLFKYAGGSFSSDTGLKKLKELEDESEYICKVKQLNNKKHQNKTILSECEVLNVYKGDDILQGQHIYVYEPSYFDFNSGFYFVFDGYNLMLIDHEYILFLNKKRFPIEYKRNNIEKYSFILTTNNPLSKYSFTKGYQDSFIDEKKDNNSLTYEDIRNLEIITLSKKNLELYNNLKGEVLKHYIKNESK